ncbi:glycosyltransferase, partial [Levilactobacillus brevis]
MIILHFTEYASGGIATYLKDLISAQSRLTDVEKIYLLVSNFNSDNDLLKLSSNKLVVIKYKYRRSVKGIFKIWSLSKLIRKLNPDIIHIHS